MPDALNFHKKMFGFTALFLLAAVVGFRVEAITTPELKGTIDHSLLIAAVCWPVSFAITKRGFYRISDALMVLFWAFAIMAPIAYCSAAAVRVGAAFPLQDDHLYALDKLVGIDVHRLSAWASSLWVGRVETVAYNLLTPLMKVTVFLPLLVNKSRRTKLFILGTMVAFSISIPLSIVFPSIGPWYAAHAEGSHIQMVTQANTLLYRTPGPKAYIESPWMCFPSFHVVWSVLCAYSLWPIRWIRWPAVVLSILIVVSTMTSEWHYLADVVAGLLIAALTIYIAERMVAPEGQLDPQRGQA